MRPGEIVTLHGPPGVGKSTVARRIALHLQRELRVICLAFSADVTRVHVLAETSRALGLPTQVHDSAAAFAAVADALQREPTLVVCDGVDFARDLALSWCSDLLELSDVAVVACAYRTLGLARERVVRVEPLSVSDAALLLEERVRRLGVAVPRRAEALSLVERVDRLPLVVEILASRVAALGPRTVLESLLCEGLDSEVLSRAMTCAWQLLNQAQRSALCHLSVFEGAFSSQSATEVVGEGGAELLDQLSRAALVSRRDDGQCILLDTVAGFARRQGALRGELSEARARHARAFAKWSSPRADDLEAWARLHRERPELVAAWRWSAREAQVDMATRLAITLDPILMAQGPAALHREVLHQTLELREKHRCVGAPDVDLLLSEGRTHAIRGLARAALPSFRRALALAQSLNDSPRIGWAATMLGYALGVVGEIANGTRLLQRALRLGVELRDLRLQGMAGQILGLLNLFQSDPQQALASYRRALSAAQLAGAPRLEAIIVSNMANAWSELGEWSKAKDAYERALKQFASIADHFHLARVSVDRAVSRFRQSGAKAAGELESALQLAETFDDLEGVLDARAALVQCAVAQGDAALAAGRLEHLRTLAQSSSDARWPSRLRQLEAGRPQAAPVRLRLSRDGRLLQLDQRHLDFRRRGPLRRVLLALAFAHAEGRSLNAHEVREAGWPDEKMFPESAAARVYMAIRRLREMGFEAVLRTRDSGYLLANELQIEWLEDVSPCEATDEQRGP